MFLFENVDQMIGIIVTLGLHLLQMAVIVAMYVRGARGSGTILVHATLLCIAAFAALYICRSWSLAGKVHVTIGEAVTAIILSVAAPTYLILSGILIWIRAR